MRSKNTPALESSRVADVDTFETGKVERQAKDAKRQTPNAERERPVTVVVADDHPVIRAGLVQVLNSQKDIRVIGEAADGSEACAIYEQLLPDVMILDLRLPKMDGLQVLRELASLKLPRPRAIIMTSYDSDHDVSQAVRLGAKAFLLKLAESEEILEAVRRVARGESFFSPEIGLRLAESMSRPELSQREIQVLQKLAIGKSNKEIGAALYITEGTVKYHVKSILKKLDAVGRAEAIAIAVKRGWVHIT
ncbi:MAG: response regulator transcription factor [Verrucomicrobia bacterium]|nr:response regulator transcription factor [Verrucomicrobiota bacterium]